MKAILVVAARPNFMKIRPVLDALEVDGVECVLVHTGQHYDPNLSDVFFEELGIRRPDEHLGIGSGSHAQQTAEVMIEFEKVVNRHEPDVLVVVGDVNSTLACALVGAKAGIVVAHVEAGLRSRDWDMPEEVNRVVADRVSDLLLSPSPDAVVNLEAEGYRADQIHLVGNVMIDTLLKNLERAQARTVLEDLGLEAGGYGMLTLHRPSNVDDAATLARLAGAINEIAEDIQLVFPVHPRTRPKLEALDLHSNVRLVEPLGYLDFLSLQASAAIVLTDSGGIQEETTVLGTPCLTLRESTERPITISEGTNTIVGTDPELIVKTAKERLANGVEARRPELWDGHAGTRIAAVVRAHLENPNRPRPTDELV